MVSRAEYIVPTEKKAEALEIPHNPTVITPLSVKEVYVQERRQKLIDGLRKGKTMVQLSKELCCDRSTLYADFNEWIKTEQVPFLIAEWLAQYELMKTENSEKAFEGLTKLIGMIIKKQPEVNVNVDVQQTSVSISNVTAEYTPEQRSELLRAWRLIQLNKADSASKPHSLH